MTNYDFLKSIEQSYFLELIKRGIVPVHIMDYLLIYETFLKELKENKKSVCITYCADKFNVHENTIRNIIKFMMT